MMNRGIERKGLDITEVLVYEDVRRRFKKNGVAVSVKSRLASKRAL
jgi:hypothetical protein